MSGTENGQKPQIPVKLVLLGEAAVGKSSLVLRFVSNDFQECKEPTIGAAFLTQKCNLSSRIVKFEIWDTAGQERFAALAPMYYRNAQAAVVVYDVTKPASFIKARHWVSELHAQASPDIIIALVGNKVDLTSSPDAFLKSTTNNDSDDIDEDELSTISEGDSRKVSVAEGRQLAEDEGILFFETSAKTGLNVQEVFTALAERVPDHKSSDSSRRANNGISQSSNNVRSNRNDDRVDLSQPIANSSQNGCAC